MNLSDYVNWYPDLLLILVIDLGLAILLMTSLRFLAGLISGVSTTEELSQRDNPAFGISLAGTIGAVTLVMSGAISGAPGDTYLDEVILVLVYGILGIALLMAARALFDKISMPALSIHDEIMKGNLAAGLVNAGNTLATGIIVRAVMIWVDAPGLDGLTAVLMGYVSSQVILTLATLFPARVYASRHPGKSIQDGFRDGNVALAVRFLGHRLGVGLAVTAASGFIPFATGDLLLRSLLWSGIALILLCLLPILSFLARKVILHGIDVAAEVDEQRNLGVGSIEAVIYVSVGFLMAALLA